MKNPMAYRTAESDAARERKPRETFTYVPRPRGCMVWLMDLAIVAATIALVLVVARKRVVQCDWPERGLGRCVVRTENALGQVEEHVIDGIHSFAYRSRVEVGFVTDARNKDREAPFGTRAIEMWDDAGADALEDFATERAEPHLVLSRGADSPVRTGLLFFAALVAYVVVTRRSAYAITIDRQARMLFVSPRGWFGRTRRYELAKVRTVDVENAAVAQHRVRIVLKSGEHVPVTTEFSAGAHHLAFATEVALALAA